MTLLETMVAIAGSLAIIGGGIWKLNDHFNSAKRAERSAVRGEKVEDAAVGSLLSVIETLRGEVLRNQADVARMSAGMTQMTAQMITQSNNMLVLKQDADRFCNLLVQVKNQQDSMVKKGTLKDRLVDINTDVLKYDPLR